MKESGTTHWSSPNTGATNESGFTALPGGDRYYTGNYHDFGTYANIWTTSEYDVLNSWYRALAYNNPFVWRNPVGKNSGISVRCLRDY